MRNLLVGNGINIQFDTKNYSRQEIVLRLLKNCDRDDFPSHIIMDEPYLLKDYLGLLFLEAREIIKGKYDRYCVCSAEHKSLEEFKDRYASSLHTLRITDIGFEDYYLIHDLACHKHKIYNPNQYTIREAMRMAYLFSIYNDGKLNELFRRYSPSFTDYLQGFDKIYTVNYDSNIENATGKQVIHLHGQFDKVSDVYDPNSMRNRLPDAPIKEIDIDPNYAFLYSNPISTHCGAYKELHIKQVPLANSALDKMGQAYKENEDVRSSVAEWISSENRLLSNFGHAIQLRVANPELCFLNNYHFADFQRLSGTLEILGFSPWNDLHLFAAIDQSDITECCFYYHGDTATEEIKKLLPRLCSSDGLRFISVKDFWEKQHEKRIKFLTPNDASKWYGIANMFAKSLISQKEALSQYNRLTSAQRSKIAQQFQSYDELRCKRITAHDENAKSRWETSIMVDAHIIAAEYDIDPVTVIMCFNAPCKYNENILVK